MNIIVNADKNWAIGKNNSLLVRIPADMKYFRQMTEGNIVVMGRRRSLCDRRRKYLPCNASVL